jgi:hypothetical protein
VHKIYFKPLVDQIEWTLKQIRLAYSTDREGDVNMEGAVDEFGTGKAVDSDKTVTQKAVGKKSRTGRVVKEPGPGASHDDIISYRQYLMSGCGRPFLFSVSMDHVWLILDCLDYGVNDYDEDDEDDEDDNGELPEPDLPTHSGGHGM